MANGAIPVRAIAKRLRLFGPGPDYGPGSSV